MKDILTTDLQSVYSTYMDNFNEPITIDGVEAIGFLQKGKKEHSGTKYLFTDKGTLQQGALINLINVLNSNWLVVEDILTHFPIYDKGLIQRCNNETKINFSGNVTSFPSIVVGIKFDVNENQQGNILNGGITITLKDNEQARKIAIDQRVVYKNQAFQVSGLDYTHDGLLILTCRLTERSDLYDDYINSIPDKYRYENTYEIVVVNGNNFNIGLNQETQLVIRVWATNKITQQRFEITNPILSYVSYDENILSVSETGNIKSLAEGITFIHVILKSNDTENAEIVANEQIEVTVHNTVIIESSVSITGGSTIFFDAKSKYTARLFKNGTEVPDTFTFKIVDTNNNTVPAKTAKLMNILATTCEVQAYDINAIIKLVAKSVSTEIEESKTITIRDIL